MTAPQNIDAVKELLRSMGLTDTVDALELEMAKGGRVMTGVVPTTTPRPSTSANDQEVNAEDADSPSPPTSAPAPPTVPTANRPLPKKAPLSTPLHTDMDTLKAAADRYASLCLPSTIGGHHHNILLDQLTAQTTHQGIVDNSNTVTQHQHDLPISSKIAQLIVLVINNNSTKTEWVVLFTDLVGCMEIVAAIATFPSYLYSTDKSTPDHAHLFHHHPHSCMMFYVHRIRVIQTFIMWLCRLVTAVSQPTSRSELLLLCVSKRWEWVNAACAAVADDLSQNLIVGDTVVLEYNPSIIRGRLYTICREQHERLLELVLNLTTTANNTNITHRRDEQHNGGAGGATYPLLDADSSHEPFTAIDQLFTALGRYVSPPRSPQGLSSSTPLLTDDERTTPELKQHQQHHQVTTTSCEKDDDATNRHTLLLKSTIPQLMDTWFHIGRSISSPPSPNSRNANAFRCELLRRSLSIQQHDEDDDTEDYNVLTSSSLFQPPNATTTSASTSTAAPSATPKQAAVSSSSAAAEEDVNVTMPTSTTTTTCDDGDDDDVDTHPSIVVAAPGTDDVYNATLDTDLTTEMATFEPLTVAVVGGGRFIAVISNQPQYTCQDATSPTENSIRRMSIVCLYEASGIPTNATTTTNNTTTHNETETTTKSSPSSVWSKYRSKMPVAVLPLSIDRDMVRGMRTSTSKGRPTNNLPTASPSSDNRSCESSDGAQEDNDPHGAAAATASSKNNTVSRGFEYVASCPDLTPTLVQGICLGNGSYERDYAIISTSEIDCNAPGGYTACVSEAPPLRQQQHRGGSDDDHTMLMMVGAGPFLVYDDGVDTATTTSTDTRRTCDEDRSGPLRIPGSLRGHLPSKVGVFNLAPLIRHLDRRRDSRDGLEECHHCPIVLLPSSLHRPHRAADGSFDLLRPKHDPAAAASRRSRLSSHNNAAHYDLDEITATNERRFQHRLHRHGHQRYFLGYAHTLGGGDGDARGGSEGQPGWLAAASTLLSRGRVKTTTTHVTSRGGKRRRGGGNVDRGLQLHLANRGDGGGTYTPSDVGHHPFLNLFPPEILNPTNVFNSKSFVATRKVRSDDEGAVFRGLSRELERPRFLKGVAATLKDLHDQRSAVVDAAVDRPRGTPPQHDDLPFSFPLAIDAMAWVVDTSQSVHSSPTAPSYFSPSAEDETPPDPSSSTSQTADIVSEEWRRVTSRVYHRGIDPAVLGMEAALMERMKPSTDKHTSTPTTIVSPNWTSSLQVVSCCGNELLRWLPFTGALLQRIVLPYSIRAVSWSLHHNSIVTLDSNNDLSMLCVWNYQPEVNYLEMAADERSKRRVEGRDRREAALLAQQSSSAATSTRHRGSYDHSSVFPPSSAPRLSMNSVWMGYERSRFGSRSRNFSCLVGPRLHHRSATTTGASRGLTNAASSSSTAQYAEVDMNDPLALHQYTNRQQLEENRLLVNQLRTALTSHTPTGQMIFNNRHTDCVPTSVSTEGLFITSYDGKRRNGPNSQKGSRGTTTRGGASNVVVPRSCHIEGMGEELPVRWIGLEDTLEGQRLLQLQRALVSNNKASSISPSGGGSSGCGCASAVVLRHTLSTCYWCAGDEGSDNSGGGSSSTGSTSSSGICSRLLRGKQHHPPHHHHHHRHRDPADNDASDEDEEEEAEQCETASDCESPVYARGPSSSTPQLPSNTTTTTPLSGTMARRRNDLLLLRLAGGFYSIHEQLRQDIEGDIQHQAAQLAGADTPKHTTATTTTTTTSPAPQAPIPDVSPPSSSSAAAAASSRRSVLESSLGPAATPGLVRSWAHGRSWIKRWLGIHDPDPLDGDGRRSTTSSASSSLPRTSHFGMSYKAAQVIANMVLSATKGAPPHNMPTVLSNRSLTEVMWLVPRKVGSKSTRKKHSDSSSTSTTTPDRVASGGKRTGYVNKTSGAFAPRTVESNTTTSSSSSSRSKPLFNFQCGKVLPTTTPTSGSSSPLHNEGYDPRVRLVLSFGVLFNNRQDLAHSLLHETKQLCVPNNASPGNRRGGVDGEEGVDVGEDEDGTIEGSAADNMERGHRSKLMSIFTASSMEEWVLLSSSVSETLPTTTSFHNNIQPTTTTSSPSSPPNTTTSSSSSSGLYLVVIGVLRSRRVDVEGIRTLPTQFIRGFYGAFVLSLDTLQLVNFFPVCDVLPNGDGQALPVSALRRMLLPADEEGDGVDDDEDNDDDDDENYATSDHQNIGGVWERERMKACSLGSSRFPKEVVYMLQSKAYYHPSINNEEGDGRLVVIVGTLDDTVVAFDGLTGATLQRLTTAPLDKPSPQEDNTTTTHQKVSSEPPNDGVTSSSLSNDPISQTMQVECVLSELKMIGSKLKHMASSSQSQSSPCHRTESDSRELVSNFFSNNSKQHHYIDDMDDDIITPLSKFEELFNLAIEGSNYTSASHTTTIGEGCGGDAHMEVLQVLGRVLELLRHASSTEVKKGADECEPNICRRLTLVDHLLEGIAFQPPTTNAGGGGDRLFKTLGVVLAAPSWEHTFCSKLFRATFRKRISTKANAKSESKTTTTTDQSNSSTAVSPSSSTPIPVYNNLSFLRLRSPYAAINAVAAVSLRREGGGVDKKEDVVIVAASERGYVVGWVV